MSSRGSGGLVGGSTLQEALQREFEAKSFAEHARDTTQVYKQNVFQVRLGGKDYVAKLEPHIVDVGHEVAASQIGHLVGVGSIQPDVHVLTSVGPSGRTLTWVVTPMVRGQNLQQLDFQKHIPPGEAIYFGMSRDMLARMILYQFAIGEKDEHTRQYIRDAAGNVFRIDHGGAFAASHQLDTRSPLLFGARLYSGAANSWRAFTVSHADIQAITSHSSQIVDIAGRMRDGASTQYFLASRLNTLGKLGALPNPTLGDLVNLTPGD